MPVVGKKSSFQTLSARGPSKSLWHEDNLYIDKVRSVYARYSNEAYITKNYGTIFWEYAMTMETVGEKYLIVPIIKDGKVVAEMEAFRVKGSVYFRFSKEDKEGFDFFQTLYNLKPTSIVEVSSSGRSEAKSGITIRVSVCRTIKITYGPIEGSPGDELPIETTKTICKFVDQMVPESECLGDVNPETGECGGGGSGGNGYPYPEPPEEVDPCEKLKAQTTNINYKAKIEALDKSSVLNLKKETGFAESKSGAFTPLPQAASTADSDGMIVTVTPSLKGYIHTHLNDYPTGTYNAAGEPLIAQPIRMFSPADVNTLMTMAGMATDGNYSELYGTMVSSYGNYTIMFTGTAADIKTGFDTEQWKTEYVKYRKDHELWNFEKLFLNFLKDKMNVQGVELYKIKNNGTVQKKTLKSNNNVQSSDCPQ